MSAARWSLAAAAALAAMALWQADQAGVSGAAAVPDVLRAVAAATVLFGAGGYALTRLWLPPEMAPHRALFVLPVGAVATGMAMTFLGFAAVPFKLSLALTLLAGTIAAALVHHREAPPDAPGAPASHSSASELHRGGGPPRSGSPEQGQRRGGPPPRPQPPESPTTELPHPGGPLLRLAWPTYLAAVIIAIALVPVFRSGFATVIGEGSDAHLATGSGNFLKHAYPTSTDPELPVDKMPLVWRSKYPIYYSLAGVSSLAGLDTVETLATLAAVLAALAALGFFLLARYLLRAGPVASLVAMALVGLNEMVLFTVTHPYFNQTWGLVAMPYMILFGWWALRDQRRGTIGLLLVFSAVGAFAYPLMLAFPASALAGFAFFSARERRREGRPVDWRAPLRRLPRGKRWIPAYILGGLLLLVPIQGVVEKVASFLVRMAEGGPWAGWAGDIRHYIPLHRFFSLEDPGGLTAPLMLLVVGAAWIGLRRAPRPVRLSLLVTAIVAAWFANYFHAASDGQYVYFKALAYLGPLVVTAAAAGIVQTGPFRAPAQGGGRRPHAGRGRQLARVALAAGYLTMAAIGARDQLAVTFDQVTPRHRDLIAWDRDPRLAGASIRLDVEPTKQLWVAYFLHHHPLSSRKPLLRTSYPHVSVGRRADYVLAETPDGSPADAAGPPLLRNSDFALYRMRAAVPGPDRSSRLMEQPIKSIPIS